jgi:formylglycine-generating enzyme required for sulfatase activity
MAQNKDGAKGQSHEGIIATIKKPLELVNVLKAEVSPQTGFSGKEFTFKANTDRPAKGVALLIGEYRYEMTGSGTNWQFKQKIDQTGNIKFSMVARNSEDAEGALRTAAVAVQKELVGYQYNRDGTVTDRKTREVKKRFVDNGDGTVTDLLTSLMWLKQPKTIAVGYTEAVDYCRNLNLNGHTGWRLPTIAEFRKLIDRKQRNPALPPGHPFTNVLTHIGYWSKSRHKFGPKYVYQMNLWYGKVGHIKKEENSVVWPVRYVELTKEG